MPRIESAGHRIELVSMDPHCENISIGLYSQESAEGREYLVRTYSSKAGAVERIEYVKRAMQTLGGMEATPGGNLRFACGSAHELGARRIFLESCKQDPAAPLKARPMSLFDKKSGLTITVSANGGGVYGVAADSEKPVSAARVSHITGGIAKLGAMEKQGMAGVSIDCGYDHDALVGLLLVRAPNVRAVLREQESAASRGMLAAPSQQK